MSCKISEETKQRLIKLVAEMGETLNAHLVELIEADVELMSDSGKAGSNPGNNPDTTECPECYAQIPKESFRKHWQSQHRRMSEADFTEAMGQVIDDRGGEKFSDGEVKILKAVFIKLKDKRFIE